MRISFRPLPRSALIFGLMGLASVVLLAIGLVGLFRALGSDSTDLPSAGSIEELIDDSLPPPDTSSADVPLQSEAPAPSGPRPSRLLIDSIDVDAPVVAMSLDSQSLPEVPNRGEDVAWYDFGALPGQGSNALFAGHVDWQYGVEPEEGAFFHLKETQVGDLVRVHLKDGQKLSYRVTANVAINYADPNVLKVMGPTAKDVITLITCGGSWFANGDPPNGGTYSHRVIVRAEKVNANATSTGDIAYPRG
ncbi:MAG: class F sortase [Dehalococcoidia bacterium]